MKRIMMVLLYWLAVTAWAGSGIGRLHVLAPADGVALGTDVEIVIEGDPEDKYCGLRLDFGDGNSQDVKIESKDLSAMFGKFLGKSEDAADSPDGLFPRSIKHRYATAGSYRLSVEGKTVGVRLPCLGEAQGFVTVKGSSSAPAAASAALSGASRSMGERNLSFSKDGAGQKRVALIIGNGAYSGGDLNTLKNPVNDAEDMAAALRKYGFQVSVHKNLGRKGMKDAIAEFGRRAANADAALFYYAGHGIQIKSQNYLVPIDTTARSEADVADEAVNINYLLEELDNAQSKINMVMLDACRDNPLSGRFRSGGGRGLAAPVQMPKGTVIVYATDPGNTAADGNGRNGLFTAGMLEGLRGQDLSLDGVLTVASEVVERDSGGKQVPYVNGPQRVKKAFIFNFQGPTTVIVAPQSASKPQPDPEAEAWQAAQSAGSAAAYQAYLETYPKGRYAAAAKVKLADLRQLAKPVEKPTAKPPLESGDPETAFWNEVKASGAREYFEAYLKQYPRGKYLALARLELKKLDDADRAHKAQEDADHAALAAQQKQEQERLEQQAWDKAKANNSLAGYEGYLSSYPKGRFAALAEAGRQTVQRKTAEKERLDAIRAETELWRTADAAKNSATIQNYLNHYPNGQYASLAKDKLAAMVKMPKTNAEIRQWYNDQVAPIPALNEQWIKQGLNAEQRARKAQEIRHHARLQAREYMQDKSEVADLQARDQQKYGNPDGPTFEYLVAANKKKGMTGDAVYEDIIGSSNRTSSEYNAKFNVTPAKL